MNRMVGRRALWFCFGLLLICLAEAATSNSVRADDNPLIDKVKSMWRAQDGEPVERIISRVAKVAHFVPRTWGVVGAIDQLSMSFFRGLGTATTDHSKNT
ncbi:hypothetical protein ABIG06_001618 [Bradyrhizobium sp. USDA 326]|uniref:hypothetical protein n=1 Tax=unclassified Bradyrhizobium TaxID=2631580 RepID=UPI003516DBBF